MHRKDPILEEIYAVRERLAREAGYDMEKLFEAARLRQEASGVKTVDLSRQRRPAGKKAS